MVRPSGGRAVVTVRRRHLPSRRGVAVELGVWPGDWRWEVPRPKGHPLPPPLDTLRGYAPTQRAAVEDGLSRLRELYGEKR